MKLKLKILAAVMAVLTVVMSVPFSVFAGTGKEASDTLNEGIVLPESPSATEKELEAKNSTGVRGSRIRCVFSKDTRSN